MNIIESINTVLNNNKIKIFGKTYQNIISDVIRNILLDVIDNNKNIGIKGAGEHTENILSLVPEKSFKFIFDKKIANRQEKVFNGQKYIILPDEYLREVDTVIISSFAHRKRMAREVKNIAPNVKIIDLYDILNENGYCVNEPFYRIEQESYENFIYYKNIFNSENSALSLMNLIRSSVDICDFLSFYKYCDMYIDKKFDRYNDVLNAKNEVISIFDNVRNEIKLRSKSDAIMIWNDQVGYKELCNAPYLNECSKHGIFFENAYTMTPFTHPVLREMFQGLKSLDDTIYFKEIYKINSDTSKFIKVVESYGYDFWYVGAEGDGNIFDDGYKITTHTYGSSCVRFIKLLQLLLDSEKPVFAVLHAAVETHNPYLSGDLEIPVWYEWPYFQGDTYDKVEMQIDKSLKYWDRQLEFYMRFLNDECIRIMMSDHGKRFDYQPIYSEDTTHVFLYINGKNVPDVRCSGMFSLYDFYKLVSCILSENYEDESIFSDMIFMQETDIFNETAVNYYIENNALESAMAFRAIRTKSELYVILANGNEHYYLNGNEKDDYIECKEYSERIAYLKQFVNYDFDESSKNTEMLEKYRMIYETHE